MLRRFSKPVAFGLILLFQVVFLHEAVGQWTKSAGIGSSFVGSFTASGNTLFSTVGAASPDSIYISSDNGATWSFTTGDTVPLIGTAMVAMGTDLVVGSNEPGGSYYSTNEGSKWASNVLDFPLPNLSRFSISSLTEIAGTIFCGTIGGVYQQTTLGAAWTPDTVGMEFSGGYPSISSFAVSGSDFFAGTEEAGVYLSTNNGASWSPINNGLPTSYFTGTTVGDMTTIGTTLFAILLDTDQIHSEIYSTTNNGQTWARSNLQSQNWNNVQGFISIGQNLYVAADTSVYLSTDNGANWVPENLGFPATGDNNGYIVTITTSGPNLVVGTYGDGIWTRKLSEFPMSSVSPNANADLKEGLSLSLSENPASDEGTKIEYTLLSGGQIQILLMDELGRTVRMLQDGFAATGMNEITLDAHTLVPGTYFVRATANGMTAMQKLVISR